jgi:hypothetical protein
MASSSAAIPVETSETPARLALHVSDDDIVLHEPFASGAFGKIYMGTLSGDKFAVKVPYLDPRMVCLIAYF